MSEDTSSQDFHQTNFCSQCGQAIKSPDAKFCAKCGTPVRQDPTGIIPGYSKSSPTNQVPASPQSPPSYVPGIASQGIAGQPGGSQYGYTQPPDSFQSVYGSKPPTSGEFITPAQITPVISPIFNKNELKIIGIISIIALLSHLLRYLMIYNRFPTVVEIILPLPFYLLAIGIIFFIQKKSLQNAGVMTIIEADYYDHTVSLVLSSFFASSINHRSRIDHELSTVPDKIHVPQSTKFGLNYVEVSKMAYIGGSVQPRSYLITSVIATLLAGFTLYLYFEFSDQVLSTTFRLISAYIGGYALMEISPIFGRHRSEIAKIAKYRSLLLFLVAFAITTVALFGQSFFYALTD